VVEKLLETDRDGKRRANLDLEIATDMMAFADKLDTVILVSGDEDFVYPLTLLAQRGVRIEVAGFRCSVSPKLMDAADKYIDLDAMVDRLRKAGHESEEHNGLRERP
jgi:uncharacterized LabA/DUF88 family protein